MEGSDSDATLNIIRLLCAETDEAVGNVLHADILVVSSLLEQARRLGFPFP